MDLYPTRVRAEINMVNNGRRGQTSPSLFGAKIVKNLTSRCPGGRRQNAQKTWRNWGEVCAILLLDFSLSAWYNMYVR